MRLSPVRLLVIWVAGLLASLGVAASLIASGDGLELFRDAEGRAKNLSGLQRVARDVSDVFAAAPGVALDVGTVAVAVAIPPLLCLLLLRAWSRRSRRYTRLTLVPYRAEEAMPEAVCRMLEALHQQLLVRWWQRWAHGQRGIALEIAADIGAEGSLTSRLSIVCPADMVGAVEGTLGACYPDSKLVQGGSVPPVERVVRLKKRYRFVAALRGFEEERRNPVDAVLRQTATIGCPCVVQYAVTPTPALFDRVSRRSFTSQERRRESARIFDEGDPGLREEAFKQELIGGLRVQHHPLFFADIRVAAPSLDACLALAGTLRGTSAAENRLVVRHMLGRSGLYLKRIRAGLANPLPGWRRGVLSSAELATLWHLPSTGLKGALIARSPVPRLLAPPEVSRAAEHELMRDERGPIGILAEDKTDGLGLIGGQKTGKTSVLCRTIAADGRDPSCAMVVLMPKPGDALKALSMIPPERTVHYLDLEHPELGINPLLAPGDPSMVADRVVDAFRDVNMEGDIRGSSDRYLRQAAQAAIGASRTGVIEGPPTLWTMYRMLLPPEAAFRQQVVSSLLPESAYIDTASFFGRELPADLREAASQTAAKLDAPRNKLLRLMVESLDKVLRHPRQLSLDDVVRNREVLVVDGKMGTFGADNCRVMMQFVLNALYGALQRQQQLPEAERARVALKVDEAHLVINESFADALATLRSAGLEVVAAWQYGEQIEDPKIRSGMMSLLRQRCMFSMGEQQDAREMSSIAMAVYADMIRPDPETRDTMRVTPDMIFNLPNHHAICSWISRGARAPAFLAQTIPLETRDDVVEQHLSAQRERGGFVPDRLPDPLPDLSREGFGEIPSEEVARPERAEGSELQFDASATSTERPNERPQPETQPAGAPDSYTELDLDNVRGIIWDKVTPLPADRRHEPTARELEILAALHSYRFLFATQIHRRWWRGSSVRSAQKALGRMHKAGWIRRFKFQLAEPGAQQRVYCLARLGFDVAKERSGRHGPYIEQDATWREPTISDPRRVLRDLHANGWVLALERRCGRTMTRWRGPRASRLDPPRRRIRGEWIETKPSEIVIGGRQLHDYEPSSFAPVSPEATAELKIAVGDSPLRLDLLIEIERLASPGAIEDRLRRYDGLISGWASLLNRYKALGTPPVVVFVCEDEPSRKRLVKVADRVVTARLAKAGAEEGDWPCPGRKAMFFALERDIHHGSLEALQLAEHPPDIRVRLGGKGDRECRPWRVHIVEPRLLRGS